MRLGFGTRGGSVVIDGVRIYRVDGPSSCLQQRSDEQVPWFVSTMRTPSALLAPSTRDGPSRNPFSLAESLCGVIHPQQAKCGDPVLSKHPDIMMLICPVHASVPTSLETFLCSLSCS